MTSRQTSPATCGTRDLRTEKALRTRAAIQASALRLAEERGYEAMTVEDVAADAGVSRRTVFNYFPTKIDLIAFGPQPPTQEEVEAFVASRGDLLDDLVVLISAGDPRAEDAEQFHRLRRVLWDNPELMPALHTRFNLFHSVIHATIARRLDTDLTDPRVRAVTALASSLQKGAVDLWAGDTPGRESARGCNPCAGPPTGPAVLPGEGSSAGSVSEALQTLASSLREVLDLPRREATRPDGAPDTVRTVSTSRKDSKDHV